MSGQYEVLNPWAEADPIPLKGISPRLTDLSGKTIGLFVGGKPASKAILSVVEQKMRSRFPGVKINWYPGTARIMDRDVVESTDKALFEDWVRSVDAAVAAVGD